MNNGTCGSQVATVARSPEKKEIGFYRYKALRRHVPSHRTCGEG